jgi:bifunctional DNA-binding transcriptional regulator/antitoxin component of YhaV-PrlF toxin-antitoxin module
MVRSAAAVIALLILASFAQAQEPVGTHTVVRDDTLWDLAQRYYSSPWEWRAIWDANRDVVEDPNLIYPDEVLTIPGLAPGARGPGPDAPPDPAPTETPAVVEGVPADLVPFGLRQARPVTDETRTIFYSQTDETIRSQIVAAAERNYLAVSADRVYSAPWLIGLEAEPSHSGWIAGFAEPQRASTIRSYDRIRVTMPEAARVGEMLQLYRVDSTIDNIGQVVLPTGLAEVTTIGDGEVVAIVVKEYERIQPGDWVGPLPDFTLEPGDQAEAVTGGPEAMIMGFEGEQALSEIGHVAFLDLGSADGLAIGDEFTLFGRAIPTSREGVLQVIGLRQNTAAARVMSMRDDVFRQGVVVRLTKKMN